MYFKSLFLLFFLISSSSFACVEDFYDLVWQMNQYKKPLSEVISESMDIETGSSIFPINIENEFSPEWLDELKRRSFPANSNILKSRFVDQPEMTDPELREFLSPIMNFAERLTEQMRKSLTHPLEKKLLRAGTVSLLWSDGSMLQLNSQRHIDRAEYMTGLFNIEGNGSLIDLPKDVKQFRNMPLAHLTISDEDLYVTHEVPPMNGVVMTQSLRDFFIPGPGSNAIPHRAPMGNKGDKRVGFVIFWHLEGMEKAYPGFMDLFEVINEVYTRPNAPLIENTFEWRNARSEALNDLMRKQYFEKMGIKP